MNKAILVGLLLVAAFANTVIVSSDPLTTVITSPSGKNVDLEAYHNKKNANYLGNGAQWIWLQKEDSCWYNPKEAVFQTLFYADCPQNVAVLTLAADDSFAVWFNGVKLGSGSACIRKQQYKLKLQCGLNNLTISVSNNYRSTPGGLVFSVEQDQSNCYNCQQNPSAFYNRQTCTCECSNQCGCNKDLYNWVGYPFCGCKCNKQIFAPCNAVNVYSYWNEKTCNCECQKRWCPEGYIQNKSTCDCVCQPRECPEGTLWNQDKCQCDKTFCSEPQICIAIYTWDPVACKCVCPHRQICQGGSIWNEKTCQCEGGVECKSPQVWNADLKKCWCPFQALCFEGYTWDDNICECVPLPCKAPQVWNADLKKCWCPFQALCKFGYTWDENTCDCVSQIQLCKLPQVWNSELQKCACPYQAKCSLGYTWDDNTCNCVPQKCTSPQAWNPDLGKCACPYISKCPAGYTWVQRTCSCQQLLICDPIEPYPLPYPLLYPIETCHDLYPPTTIGCQTTTCGGGICGTTSCTTNDCTTTSCTDSAPNCGTICSTSVCSGSTCN